MQVVPERDQEGVAISHTEQQASYVAHVNPIWAKLLDVLGMNVQYTHACGAELFTADGRTILDCPIGILCSQRGSQPPLRHYPADCRIAGTVPGDAAKQCRRECRRTCPDTVRVCRWESFKGILLQLGERRHRSGHQVRPRAHGSKRHRLCCRSFSWAYLRCSFTDGQRVLAGRLRPHARRYTRGSFRRPRCARGTCFEDERLRLSSWSQFKQREG